MNRASKEFSLPDYVRNAALKAWVAEVALLTQPDAIHWCDGSEAEDLAMRRAIVASGAGVWLDPERRPNSLLVRSDQRDVARVEERTFICSRFLSAR